jgi:hypothetical protein
MVEVLDRFLDMGFGYLGGMEKDMDMDTGYTVLPWVTGAAFSSLRIFSRCSSDYVHDFSPGKN